MAAFHVGDRVRFVNESMHKQAPDFYPDDNTIGKVKAVERFAVLVQWPNGSTSCDDMYYADPQDLEKVEE